MKTFVGIVICICAIVACSSKKIDDATWDITLKGKVGFPQAGGVITLRELNPDNTGHIDTIALGPNSTYEHKVHLTQPGFYQLNFYNLQIMNLILNKSNLEINVDGNNMQGLAEIKGSPEHDLLEQVKVLVPSSQNSPELAELERQYTEATQKHEEARVESIRSQYLVIYKKGMDKVAALLLKQPGSLATLDLLMQGNLLDKDVYANVYEDAAEKLKKELPNSVYAKEFVSQIEKSKPFSVGKIAPDIALPNPKGDTIRLSSLRGKYVLVDFWAKWCGPCRGENPYVVAAYHKFKSKGFEVYGVSLDRNKSEWEQAIAEDGLVWTQVSDLQYFNSAAAKLYNINAIPFSLLLDPKGIIIAKNLRGPALEKKLEEVLGK